MNERQTSYQILKEVIVEGQYANLLMRSYRGNDQLNFGFVTEMVYGVLRNYDYLTFQWSKYINKKCDTNYVILINMAIYELLYLNSKEYAVLNEIVDLAGVHQKGFVNAVLRKYIANGELLAPTNDVKYSVPTWIYNLWKAHYGEEKAIKLAKSCVTQPILFYRLNTTKCQMSDLTHLNIKAISDICFTSSDNLIKSDEFKEGLFIVQDYGSSRIVSQLDVIEHLTILDMCSAPGTKTTQMASMMNNTGSIIAADIHEHRLKLVDSLAGRLGLSNIETMKYDGTQYNEAWCEMFDRVLIDVPCSGLGVLARKPDIKFRLKDSDIDDLVNTQALLLRNGVRYLKHGGILVYSTCTLNLKENQRQISKLLLECDNLALLNEENIWPYDENTDGFYIAKLLKK